MWEESELDVDVDGVAEEEEDAREEDAGMDGREDAGLEGCGAGADVGDWFLRLRQDLLSESVSLRRRFVRERAGPGRADAAAGSGSLRGVEVRRLVPAAGGGRVSVSCCWEGGGEEGGEVRGDEAGHWSRDGLGGELCSSSSAVNADEAAREYDDETVGASLLAMPGNMPASSRAEGAEDRVAETGVSGRDPWGRRVPF